jgi:electron transport complex protein RnfE
MARVQDFTKGLWKEIPVLRLMLGLCPTLAVSTAVDNAIGMGVAFTFVLLGSNIAISLLRGFIPKQVRIPAFIVVIAAFVTIIELTMQAFQPKLYESLGIFVPLIVVNCIVLGRAEAFASRNTVSSSALDALGMGVGFTLVLFVLAFIRELLGTGMVSLFGRTIVPGPLFQPAIIMILPPGAFVTLGLMMALMNKIGERSASAANKR